LTNVFTYSNIKGVQLYWDISDYSNPPSESCGAPNYMTIRGDDANTNSQAMIGLAYIAFTTGKKFTCVAKSGCTGINSNNEANYCYISK